MRSSQQMSGGPSINHGLSALVSSSPANDPQDRHVLAAAVASDTQAVVTLNLKHFPKGDYAARPLYDAKASRRRSSAGQSTALVKRGSPVRLRPSALSSHGRVPFELSSQKTALARAFRPLTASPYEGRALPAELRRRRVRIVSSQARCRPRPNWIPERSWAGVHLGARGLRSWAWAAACRSLS